MKINLPNALTTRFSHQVLTTQKHSPQILFFGGMALMGATVVSACRGTLKLEATLEDIKLDREDLERRVHNTAGTELEMAPREITKLNAYVTFRGLARVAKLYTPALIFGSLAVAALTGSHNTLNKRNAGLSAALAATDRALDNYRQRVREAYGEDKELALYRGEETKTVAVLDDEGRETKSTKKVKTGGGKSPYSFLWGKDTSSEWDPHSDYNLAKLRSVQEWGTLQLNSKGHLFLNDIFDELGLPRTPVGAVCGWLSEKYGGQDGYVDLGVLRDGNEPAWLDFVRGFEENIWLDPNVDGEIWRKI